MNPLDPLSGYADPRLYVALDTGERALAAIRASLMAGRSPVLLSGPCGIGKTLLLRVLAEREWRSFPRVRFSPSLAVEPDELAGCLLYLLFGKRAPEGREAESALLTKLRSPVDQPTLLLVDNIHRASVACVHELAALTRACSPALAVVVTGTDGPDLRALTPALSPEVTVSLPESLPEREIEALYESILAHPGLSQRIRYRLAGVERAEVVRAAAGFPRLLRSELVRRTVERPSSAPEPRRVEVARPETLRAPAPAVIAPAAQTRPDRAPRPRTRRIPAARQAVRAAAMHLPRPVRVIVPAASALPSRLLDACVSLTRLPRTIGSSARGAGAAVRLASTARLRRVRGAVHDSASRVGASVVAAGRSTRALVVSGHANVTRVVREIGVAARSARVAVHRTSTALLWSVGGALRDSASRVGASVVAARRPARALVVSGHANVTRAAREIGVAARSARVAVRRASTVPLRSAPEAARRARATLLASSHAYARRARRNAQAAREAAKQGSAALARAGIRAVPLAAVPATAVLAVALLSLADHATEAQEGPARGSPAFEARAETETRNPPPVDVQVNARPWARVRIDGIDVGATPLSRPLAPGVYQLEAEFPNGRRIERKIDVTAERRFVSLP